MSKPKTAAAPASEQPAEVAEVSKDGIFRPKSLAELNKHDRAVIKEARESLDPVKPIAPEPEVPAEAPAPVPETAPADEPETIVPPPPAAEKKSGIDPSTKVTVKIDGEEREVTFDEVVRGYQTDQHLSKKGNKISAERMELERLRQENLAKPRATAPATEETEPENPLAQQIREMIAEQIRAATSPLEPLIFERNRDALADKLKSEGFPNFKEYLPKIQAHVATVEDQRQFEYYNTAEGTEALFFRMLAQDAAKQASKPPVPAIPAKPAMERPRPPVIKIPDASASGVVNDDANDKYAAAMDEYRRSGGTNKEAFYAALRTRLG